MTKKILIFSLAYYPRHVSGAEAAIKEITDRIDPSDIEFHMVTLRFDAADAASERVGRVSVHRVGSGSYLGKVLFPLSAALKARALHQTLRFDALWAMMTYMLLPTMLAKMLGVRVPHILTLQDGDPYEKVFGRLRVKPFLPLIDRGFRTAGVVQAISRYLAGWPARRGSGAPVELVYNGANPRDLADAVPEAEVEGVRRALGKKEGDIFLVNTSRLVHQKGNDTTIRALPLLPPHVKLALVGGGEDEAMLRNLARELGVENRVIFIGQVDRRAVSAYRRACDIFVAPSRSEGLGNAFLSALASRLPLVTSGVGGIADYAVEGETAWLVPADDPASLAEKIKEVIGNPQKARALSQRARAMVEERYDWDKIVRHMRQRVFAKVL